ncbi:asparagine synthase-related protein [Streptomyces sp. ME19-01-6]|uniref:asparagine synthase-related protein n=1 Tax=Streptomyces sp. ME19-01-6 TaxID=3028686 RepID=UPI0029A1CE6C|nr:asparagine synthase-related protein [Streptomyces sp. ME19-01-6]MDX3230856.1 asparagine synthase-related protein [Streptomyces sp. ME19-01-6]
MADAGWQYFVALPDNEGAAAAIGRLPTDGVHILLRHRSGRPCAAGRLAEGRALVAERGDTRLAVIGHCSATQDELAAAAARIDDVTDLDRLGLAWAGSYHLVASVRGRLRVQGTASGLRRIFHGELGALTVAADRADVLATVLDAPLDPALLALRTLDALPHPLGDLPPWRNVSAVPPGSYLALPPDGRRPLVTPWWQAPEPVRSLTEGGRLLRQALDDAVRVRTRGAQPVSADLSGGMDSTSIALLAARYRPALTTLTMENDDQADEDVEWARQAAAGLPDLNHIIYSNRELPHFWSGLMEVDGVPDEPSIAVLSAPRLRAVRQRALAHGSRLHLDGLGGDQLLCGHPAYQHDLLRRRPLLAAQRLRVLNQLRRSSWGATARGLLDGRSYRRWFADRAHGRVRRAPSPLSDWGHFPGLPVWLTPDARDLITRTLHDTAATAEPLAPTRGRHNDLLGIQDAGRLVRQCHQLTETQDFSHTSPFLDDQVIQACLAVRPEQRVTPWEFKPLIKTAMADVMPPGVLTRRTKGDGTTLVAEGFEKHRRELAELWDGSRLAALGLIDPGPLRELFDLSYTNRLHQGAMQSTLSCELWARATATQPAAATHP